MFTAKSQTFDSRCVRRLFLCFFVVVGGWLLRPGWLGRGRPAKQLSHCAARGGAGASAPPRRRRSLAPPNVVVGDMFTTTSSSLTHAFPASPAWPARPTTARSRRTPTRGQKRSTNSAGERAVRPPPIKILRRARQAGQRLGQDSKSKRAFCARPDARPSLRGHVPLAHLAPRLSRTSVCFSQRPPRKQASKRPLLRACWLAGSAQARSSGDASSTMTSVSFTTPHLQKTPLVSAFPVCVCVCVSRACLGRYFWRKHGIAKKRDAFSAVTTSQACPP